MNIYDKIDTLCKEHGMNIHKLEMELEFGNGSLKKGGDKIGVDRLLAIADYFDVDINYFLSDKKEPTKTVNPLVVEILQKTSNCSDETLEKILDYANFIISKR